MFLYFVRGTLSKKIKIGVTDRCPKLYMKQTIQARSGETVELLGVVPAGDEREIQLQFSRDWSHGEWFDSSNHLMAHIRHYSKPHACDKCPKDGVPVASPWQRHKKPRPALSKLTLLENGFKIWKSRKNRAENS